ncbi:hypothetical protein D3C71_1028640 [compost metagenome]
MKKVIQFHLNTDDAGEVTNKDELNLYEHAIVNIKGQTDISMHIGYVCQIGNIDNGQFYIMENAEREDGFDINLIIFSDEKEFIETAKEMTHYGSNRNFRLRIFSNYVSEEALAKYI